jgi:hypothetical protein
MLWREVDSTGVVERVPIYRARESSSESSSEFELGIELRIGIGLHI